MLGPIIFIGKVANFISTTYLVVEGGKYVAKELGDIRKEKAEFDDAKKFFISNYKEKTEVEPDETMVSLYVGDGPVKKRFDKLLKDIGKRFPFLLQSKK